MFIFANTQAGIDFFDANAEAVGYQATDTLPAGLVAWEAKAKEIVAQHIHFISEHAASHQWGKAAWRSRAAVRQVAMPDIFDWGVAAYPGRFGIMSVQVQASSGPNNFL